MLSPSVVRTGQPEQEHPGVVIGPMADGEAVARRLKAERERHIAERAYARALARGFEPGHELEDWLEAEREVDAANRSV